MSREPAKAPCREACPAGIDVPRYLRLIVAGKYAEALAVIRESIPLPAVCGYVCPGPCEIRCRLAEIADAPEAIRALKRFVADHAFATKQLHHRAMPPTGKRVAVVGSGPAGLTAAYHLAMQGHRVTLFEALPEAGGMMRVGIPAYRLPRNVLDAEIENIVKAGVDLRTGARVESLDRLLAEGYDVAFVAVGAHRGARMGIGGEESPGVIDALSFLRRVNLREYPTAGRSVAVVGGGNSAVDAARTALRLGGFPLVELPLSPETAVREANRCLRCDLPIVALETNCRSCFICQLVCSLRFEGAFDTSKAAIGILPVIGRDGDVEIRISFDDKCDGCGLCVRYCPFGALTRGVLNGTSEPKPEPRNPFQA